MLNGGGRTAYVLVDDGGLFYRCGPFWSLWAVGYDPVDRDVSKLVDMEHAIKYKKNLDHVKVQRYTMSYTLEDVE